MKAWLNGKLINRDSAQLSAFDAAIQHGIGLFETMRATGHHIYRIESHLNRLAESARQLRLTDKLHIAPLIEAVQQTVVENNLENSRIRLTLTGGDLNLLQSQHTSPATPSILIVAQPATQYPDELFENGARVIIADGRLNPFDPTAGHKTINYWSRLQALQQAAAKQSSEALWFSVTNHLMSGSVSNLFIVKDGTLLTPIAHGEESEGSLPSVVLPGITRKAVIELAQGIGIGTSKQMLDINQLLEADEVFLTNSSWGILPVTAVEAENIADGNPGQITKQLRTTWLNDQTPQQ